MGASPDGAHARREVRTCCARLRHRRRQLEVHRGRRRRDARRRTRPHPRRLSGRRSRVHARRATCRRRISARRGNAGAAEEPRERDRGCAAARRRAARRRPAWLGRGRGGGARRDLARLSER